MDPQMFANYNRHRVSDIASLTICEHFRQSQNVYIYIYYIHRTVHISTYSHVPRIVCMETVLVINKHSIKQWRKRHCAHYLLRLVIRCWMCVNVSVCVLCISERLTRIAAAAAAASEWVTWLDVKWRAPTHEWFRLMLLSHVAFRTLHRNWGSQHCGVYAFWMVGGRLSCNEPHQAYIHFEFVGINWFNANALQEFPVADNPCPCNSHVIIHEKIDLNFPNQSNQSSEHLTTDPPHHQCYFNEQKG